MVLEALKVLFDHRFLLRVLSPSNEALEGFLSRDEWGSKQNLSPNLATGSNPWQKELPNESFPTKTINFNSSGVNHWLYQQICALHTFHSSFSSQLLYTISNLGSLYDLSSIDLYMCYIILYHFNHILFNFFLHILNRWIELEWRLQKLFQMFLEIRLKGGRNGKGSREDISTLVLQQELSQILKTCSF